MTLNATIRIELWSKKMRVFQSQKCLCFCRVCNRSSLGMRFNAFQWMVECEALRVCENRKYSKILPGTAGGLFSQSLLPKEILIRGERLRGFKSNGHFGIATIQKRFKDA